MLFKLNFFFTACLIGILYAQHLKVETAVGLHRLYCVLRQPYLHTCIQFAAGRKSTLGQSGHRKWKGKRWQCCGGQNQEALLRKAVIENTPAAGSGHVFPSDGRYWSWSCSLDVLWLDTGSYLLLCINRCFNCYNLPQMDLRGPNDGPQGLKVIHFIHLFNFFIGVN